MVGEKARHHPSRMIDRLFDPEEPLDTPVPLATLPTPTPAEGIAGARMRGSGKPKEAGPDANGSTPEMSGTAARPIEDANEHEVEDDPDHAPPCTATSAVAQARPASGGCPAQPEAGCGTGTRQHPITNTLDPLLYGRGQTPQIV